MPASRHPSQEYISMITFSHNAASCDVYIRLISAWLQRNILPCFLRSFVHRLNYSAEADVRNLNNRILAWPRCYLFPRSNKAASCDLYIAKRSTSAKILTQRSLNHVVEASREISRRCNIRFRLQRRAINNQPRAVWIISVKSRSVAARLLVILFRRDSVTSLSVRYLE